MRIVFPWFPKELSPNARVFWAKKARITKTYRTAWFALAREALAQRTICFPPRRPIALRVTFFPPDRRLRDLDNCIGSIKSGMDGLAQALEVNDRLFIPTYQLATQIAGTVVVDLSDTQRGSFLERPDL